MVKKIAGALIAALLLCGNSQAAPSGSAIIATTPQPAWAALNKEQKAILAPLAGEWDRMENHRRKKWLSIAERYKQMKPEEQQRLQEKMQDWARLTPDQRLAARERFKEFNQMPAEEQEAVKQRWQEYRQQKDGERSRPADAPADTAPEPSK